MHFSLLKFILIIFLTISTVPGLLSAQIDYAPLNDLLKTYVHDKKVDYKNLLKEKKKLFAFTEEMGKISPKSHPANFKTTNEKLAFWINAYNAFILRIIIDNYPIESIKDINFIGFTIWLHKNLIGGENISFKSLEDDIIRSEFKDPRIHFAINCASYSCPPLVNRAYMPSTLNEQMESSTRNFINDRENFKIDNKEKIIYLSSIFDWYDTDFYEYLIKNKNIKEPHLLDFIKLYYEHEIKNNLYQYEVVFIEYNWNLNDL